MKNLNNYSGLSGCVLSRVRPPSSPTTTLTRTDGHVHGLLPSVTLKLSVHQYVYLTWVVNESLAKTVRRHDRRWLRLLADSAAERRFDPALVGNGCLPAEQEEQDGPWGKREANNRRSEGTGQTGAKILRPTVELQKTSFQEEPLTFTRPRGFTGELNRKSVVGCWHVNDHFTFSVLCGTQDSWAACSLSTVWYSSWSECEQENNLPERCAVDCGLYVP